MKQLTLAWIFGVATVSVLGACAKVEEDGELAQEPTRGTGGASGMLPMGSGGSKVVTQPGSGGAQTVCTPGDELPCANVNTNYKVGTSSCAASGQLWDLSTCGVCEKDATRPCAEDPPGTPARAKGEMSCASDLRSWDDTQCEVCSDGDPLACASVPEAVSAGKLVGTALCASGIYVIDTCGECDAADVEHNSIACTELESSEHVFTGGTATCALGSWNTAACDYCGNGTKSSGEVCDGVDIVATTCGDLGYGSEIASVPVTECLATCEYDSSPCGSCTAEILDEAKCFEGGSCSGVSCLGAQCGRGFECEFNCSQAAGCTEISCAQGSTCDVHCDSGSGTCDVECLSEADCTVEAGSGRAIDVTCADNSKCTVPCGSGAACKITCGQNAECQNTATSNSAVDFSCGSGSLCDFAVGSGATSNIECERGAKCSMDVTASSATATGVAYCADATCSYTFSSQNVHPVDIVCEDQGTCEINNLGSAHISDITCEAGSTCAVTCGSNGSCKNIRCEEGASCDITCNNNSTCEYLCEGTENCTCTGGGTCTKLPWTEL